MRILLFTGKGGVGKSTIASGTAALAAADGHRTLVLSTDAAHSLADAFGAPVGPEPTEVAPRLFVQQVDAQLRFQQSWADIQRYLLSVLDVAGVDPVAAEELTVIPGAEEVLALLELRLQAMSGRWDVVVVDCAPTAETLRLLALPEALGWYMHRVLPAERRIVKALKPVLTRAAGVPMPGDDVFDAIERLHAELEEALPPGLDVLQVVESPGGSLADRLDASRWTIDVVSAPDVTAAAVEGFLAHDSVLVERMTKKGLREFDCRAAVVSLTVAPHDQGARLELVLRHATTPAVRPDDVLRGLTQVSGLEAGSAPLLTRQAQGPLDPDTGEVGDPLA